MDFFELIKTRRSVRRFAQKPLDRAIIEQIIEAGAMAPTACNIQGWRFVVVDEDNLKQKIVDMGGSVIIKTAPVAIFVFYDNRTTNTEYKDYIQSASAAAENMLLAAHHLGLGACWINHLPQKKDLQKLFRVPIYFEPILCIILGEKMQPPTEVPRKHSLDQIIGYNIFKNTATEQTKKISTMEKILRKIYYMMPTFLKNKFNKFIDKKFVKKFNN